VSALRRTFASIAAWTLGAGVAVVVGMLALSLIDDGLAAGQPVPGLAPAPRVADATAASPAAEPSESGTTAPAGATPATSAAAGSSRQLSSPGGTVTARCTSTGAYLVSWSPAQGYEADDVHRGPARTVSVVFRAGSHRAVLAVRCVDGLPQPVPGWHEDDGPATSSPSHE
jgi:hypothetical protein